MLKYIIMKIDLQLCGTNKQFDKDLSFGKVVDEDIYDEFLFAPSDVFIYLVGKNIDEFNTLTVLKEIHISNRNKAIDQLIIGELKSQLEQEWHKL